MADSAFAANILILDDDENLHESLGDFLKDQRYHIVSVSSGEKLGNVLANNHIDLIIMDILLPKKKGLNLLQWVKKQYKHIPVLVLSSLSEAADRVEGLASGANDYLPKPFNHDELLLRVRNLLNLMPRKKNIDYSHCFNPDLALYYKDGEAIKLTRTETRLLQFMFSKPGEVITRDAISEALRGNEHHPLDRSIDVHVNRLRGKIEPHPPIPKYLVTVWGKGYRFIPPSIAQQAQ